MSCLNRLCFIAITLLLLHVVQAFNVSPMVSTMTSTGSGARISYLVDNSDGNYDIAIEAIPYVLQLTEEGEEQLLAADDDIIVFPPTATIPKGQTQVFQAQYIGEPDIDMSVTYRVFMEELPVAKTEGAQAVIVRASFGTLLSVVPDGSKAALEVTSIVSDDYQWQLTVRNNGNRFARLSETSWSFNAGGQSHTLKGAKLASSLDENLVLPGTSRTVGFKAPEDMSFDENTSIVIDSAL